ncbi:hypothetical protein GGTG_06683 [Gaeumannomyces tritici R3-111a-1]|uniref:Nab2-like CCCH zinc finger domain-containing protein n=1 Tax=Gaeumannomyces tritici (strain R3-111a-1) TaxID=644352 RepID=J3NZI5_GAET3|nr:hypothetical protein GGTG_06683 [Gaeumannomyces tritici R3-111a-1]EJT76768.1 hypothetical protein GGTG_06683 [Gaeumannomyces tritici R3-111a-1]
MAEVALNTPLADALTSAITPKLLEVGWGTGGADDAALAEYIVLMLVNGKSQAEIASELAGDLLSLGPDDPGALDFAKWLFQQVDLLKAQSAQSAEGDAAATTSQGGDQDTEMGMVANAAGEINAPTGPKAMRNGSASSSSSRGNPRDRRMMGQINRALDRTQDSVLHRTRGNDRINSHARQPPNGPRGGLGRQARGGPMNIRGASIAHGMATAMGGVMPPGGPPGMNGGMPPGMNNGGAWMPGPNQDPQMGLFHMLEQQNQMMQHLQQQLNQQMMMQQHQQQGGPNGFHQNAGRPLSERVQHQNRNNGNFRKGPHHNQNGNEQQPADGAPNGGAEGAEAGEDAEMGGQAKREASNPKETVCKFNLSCTNRECKFAHQSPAASPGTTVDVTDWCSYGGACKNHKCVGAHPSPATRSAHQSQQDCRFYPNCTNPHCTFRHPSMPPCRNGGDCSVTGCKFTHVKTQCKFRPCTNRFCPFKHDEGQRGTFQDKVWTADGAAHLSERKFTDDDAPVEDVLPGADSGTDGAADSDMAASEAVAASN